MQGQYWEMLFDESGKAFRPQIGSSLHFNGHGLRHSLVSIYDEIDFGARRLVHEIVQLVARIHFVASLAARKQFLGNELLCNG